MNHHKMDHNENMQLITFLILLVFSLSSKAMAMETRKIELTRKITLIKEKIQSLDWEIKQLEQTKLENKKSTKRKRNDDDYAIYNDQDESKTCNHCHKLMKNSKSRRRHVEICFMPKVSCPHCKREWYYRSLYSHHLTHSNKQINACDLCKQALVDARLAANQWRNRNRLAIQHYLNTWFD
jgi:hypothetical protein